MTQEVGPTYANISAPGRTVTNEGSQEGIRLRGGNSTSERLGQSDSESRTDDDEEEEEDVSMGDLSRLDFGVTESRTKYTKPPPVAIPGAALSTRGM